MIDIVDVHPGSREEAEFIELPRRIYRDNPYFVPWFDRSMRKIIARDHPYFEHSSGEFFLAVRDGETLGRIALLEPRRYNEYQHQSEARFYFLELYDEADVAQALFRHAEAWTRERDLTRLVGPQGFSAFAGAGILIHGFDRSASMTMMPYHLPYYRNLVESNGFGTLRDFHSPYLLAGKHDLTPKYQRAAEIAMKRGRFHVPEYRTKRELRKVAQEIRETYNDAFGARDNITPLTEAELDQIVEDILIVAKPSLIRVLRAGDELAGFVLAFPDLSDTLRAAGGKLNVLTYLRLLWAKRTTKRFLINGLGIKPEYRGRGGTELLFAEITKALKEHHVEGAEMTQIAADNDLMTANIERLGADIVKTHRVYAKSVSQR